MMADVDPETGRLLVDEHGHPVKVPHFTAVEAAPYLGVKPHRVREAVRSGEWPGRLTGAREVVMMTHRHIAEVIVMLSSNTGLTRKFDFEGDGTRYGVRGLVLPPDGNGDDEEGAQ